MAVTVGLVAAFAYYVLGLPLGAAVLLGAILAPTDPVLATDVQIRHPGDRDQLRFTLTCEAGMNDGSAFPFVMLGLGLLGLHELGDFGLRWVLVDVLWATLAGIAIGVAAGVALARLGGKLRAGPDQHELMDDFLGLGLIGVVYGVCGAGERLGFPGGVLCRRRAAPDRTEAGRRAEPRQENARRRRRQRAPPAALRPRISRPPTVSGGSLVFKEHLERLSELVLVLLIGGTLFLDSWSWRAVALAAVPVRGRPPAQRASGPAGTRTPWRIRGMTGWFGVRGIGSLYYLMYAIQHGLPEPLALELIQMTLIVVTLSILVHGISVKPLMAAVWRRT